MERGGRASAKIVAEVKKNLQQRRRGGCLKNDFSPFEPGHPVLGGVKSTLPFFAAAESGPIIQIIQTGKNVSKTPPSFFALPALNNDSRVA